jgi:Flp pilus assembly protein protease CpaA
LVKAIMLAAAFMFWAANQLWPDIRQATLFNDIAVALFVLDVFLVMIGWPATSPDESFAEAYVAPDDSPCTPGDSTRS